MSQNIPPPLDTISEGKLYSNKSSTQRNFSTTSVFSSYTLTKRCRSERDIPIPVMSKEDWMNAHQCKRTRSLDNEYKKSMAEINAEFDEKATIVKDAFQFFTKYKSFDALPEYKVTSGSSGSLENKFHPNSSNEAHSDSSSLDSKSGSFVSTGETAYTKAVANTDLKMEKRPIIPEFLAPPSNIDPITFSDTVTSDEKTNSSQGTTSALSPQHEVEAEEEEEFSVLQKTATVQETTTVEKKQVITKKKAAADDEEAEVEEIKISEKRTTKTTTTTTATTTIEEKKSP